MNNRLAHIDYELMLVSLDFKEMKCNSTQYETYYYNRISHLSGDNAEIRLVFWLH